MADRLNRFRQLEGPREPAGPAAGRTSTTGRIDAVLGPGEKAPAGPAAAPPTDDGGATAAPGPPAEEPVPISPETLAAMKGSRAELEALLMRELERRPRHAGEQITLFRSIMRRSVEEIEGRHEGPGRYLTGVAVVLGIFSLGGLLLAGPRLWQLLFAVGAGILFRIRLGIKSAVDGQHAGGEGKDENSSRPSMR
jgi:hypothetical protein